MNITPAKRRIVYLFGAGASHASIKARNSMYSILTKDLNQPLLDKLRPLVVEKGSPYEGLLPFFNDVMTNDAISSISLPFLTNRRPRFTEGSPIIANMLLQCLGDNVTEC